MATIKTKEVLTKEYGIANNTTPTGRVLGFKKWEVNPSLYQICYVDGGQGQNLPEYLKDAMYTNPRLAEADIKVYVTQFWDKTVPNEARA